jgi:AraC-like DNA-binding protein
MSGRFRLSRLLVARLDELGVAPAQVVRRAGLRAGWLDEERLVLDTAEFFAFWTAVETLSRDALLGLRLGGEDRVERYDPISLAALSASCFRDAVNRASRYKQVMCPEEIRLVDRGSEGHIRFLWLRAAGAPPNVLQDLCFAWIFTLGRRGTGRTFSPLRVEFSRKGANRRAYESHFGCPVHFEAGEDTLVFAQADLDRAFRTQNADLLAMIAPQLEQELMQQQAAGGGVERVKATMKRLLAGRRPELRDVSREMGVSTRTLQRRLADAGATYQRLLEEARRELAHHYLLSSTLELSETAYLLGYEDASSFFRAFHRWEGSPPGQWRELRRGKPGDATLAHPAGAAMAGAVAKDGPAGAFSG